MNPEEEQPNLPSPPASEPNSRGTKKDDVFVLDALEAVDAVGTISPVIIFVSVLIALLIFMGITAIFLYIVVSGVLGGSLQPLRNEPLEINFERGTETFWQIERETEPQPNQEPLVLRESMIADGQYRLASNQPNELFWKSAGLTLGPGIYEVDLTIENRLEGNGAGIILLLADQDEAARFLLFELDPTGFAWIGLCENNCANATPLTGSGWFAIEALNQDKGAVNRLRVSIKEGEMISYVNDVEVGYVLNWRISGAGDVGFLIETGDGGEMSADFDNFTWRPHTFSAE
ncbi:MAG: hypothetical protein AAGD96_24165 [Chloroflexota bacterium]